jgi:hypothetical protein
MTALVIFVLGVLLLVGLAAGLGGRRYPTGEGTYTGEMVNRLFATVDRVFRRRRLP